MEASTSSSLINIKTKAFNSLDEIKDYMRRDDYGSEESPEVCFGFSIVENNDAHYQVYLIFND